MKELDAIKHRYKKRMYDKQIHQREAGSSTFVNYMKNEREYHYERILKSIFVNLSIVKLMEIGAGGGDNLLFFNQIGIEWKNIYLFQ